MPLYCLVICLCESPDLSLDGSAKLVFPSGGESQSSCVSVTITGDDLFEGEEMYCLTLESSDPDIIVGSTSFTCVLIGDDDCMLDILSCIFDGFFNTFQLSLSVSINQATVFRRVYLWVFVWT